MPWLDIATGQFKDDDEGCVISEQMTISEDGMIEVQSSTTYTSYGMS